MSKITLFDKKSDCCGCGACASICPKKAVTMAEDNEGFLYPSIDEGKCIECKRCLDVCPIKHRRDIQMAEKSVPHIGILNLQNTMNYGAAIAAVVLQNTVQTLVGEHVCVLTLEYVPKYQGSKIGYIPYFVKINNGWISCFRAAFRRIFKEDRRAMDQAKVIRKQKYQVFRGRFLRLSVPYRSAKEFHDGTNWKAMIVGSDIVWHPKHISTFRREAFFFSFADGTDIKRISYAASTDSSNEVLKRYQTLYRDGLMRMDRISVREKTNIKFLQQLTDKPIANCCDPAFLYTAEQYEEMLSTSAFQPNEEEQYMYVYVLDHNDFMVQYAKKLAEEKGMKIYFFAPKYPNMGPNAENCMTDGPAEFLARLKYAAYVLTNSFHCCIFSLLFQKKFLSFERGKTSIKSRDLLSEFGLLSRIVSRKSQISIEEPIDFERVKNVIGRLQKESLDFLKDSLEIEKA